MLFIQNVSKCCKNEFVSKLGAVDPVTRLMLHAVCTHMHKHPSTVHWRWWNMPGHRRSRYSSLSDMDQGNMRTAAVVGDNSGNRRRTKTFRSPCALSSLAGRFCPKLFSDTFHGWLFTNTRHQSTLCQLLESLFQRVDKSPVAFLHSEFDQSALALSLYEIPEPESPAYH